MTAHATAPYRLSPCTTGSQYETRALALPAGVNKHPRAPPGVMPRSRPFTRTGPCLRVTGQDPRSVRSTRPTTRARTRSRHSSSASGSHPAPSRPRCCAVWLCRARRRLHAAVASLRQCFATTAPPEFAAAAGGPARARERHAPGGTRRLSTRGAVPRRPPCPSCMSSRPQPTAWP